MICPVCRGEFVPGIVQCPDCHQQLVDKPQDDPARSRSEPWITVAEIGSPVELTVLKSLLESHGIPVFVPGERSFQQVPVLHLLRHTSFRGGQCKVQVPQSSVDEARDLLAAKLQDD